MMKPWMYTGIVGLAFGAVLAGAVFAQTPAITVPADKALVIVRVPTDDAVVKIGNFTSSQRGRERIFFTPVLTVGRAFSYEIEASWMEDGRQKRAVRLVKFRAGQSTIVEFKGSDPGEKIAAPAVVKKGAPEKNRHFTFTYGGKVKDLTPDQLVRVWLPVATSGPEQTVTIVKRSLPGNAKTFKERQYGNTMFYFSAKADKNGEIPFEITYDVRRREVKTDLSANLVLKPAPQENLTRFLEPDAKVPIVGKPLELLKDKNLPGDQFAAAKVLYDVVNGHMKYSMVGDGWGQGDSVWACDSKFGNCSDFHSLFISMARGNKIPSKFEMGFSIPTQRGKGPIGGYHCWAWFYPNERGWVPVDISEANRNPEMKEYYFGNLTEDRVRFNTGRDIHLEPRQNEAALNFFIYPYVEVNGKAYPQENIERRFAYEDVK